MDDHDQPLLSVEHLAVSLTGGDVRLVDDVSFSLSRGEALGLVGESGSGKSLTLRALLGLLPKGTEVTSGHVRFDGTELVSARASELRRLRGRRIGMVFQDPMTALNPVMTVGDQIAEGRVTHLGESRRVARRYATALMGQVGIADPARRARAYPHEFSGGMRQRVVIAIALACEPALILCDEPTTALDVTIQRQILTILDELRGSRELAVLFVTHDLAVIAQICERVAVMYAGQIVESGPTAEVFASPRHGYTDGLLRSVPDLHLTRARLEAITGMPPGVADMPLGCRFHPRCPLADDACCLDRGYPLRAVGGGRRSACVHSERVGGHDPVVADA
ncbi:MAG TPA: ABC transporter ATP-binding protein [Solirubrobacteraceae bacterium]|jgi:oligopeptide/dipeptide ABC transporter ATP-binding protein|nr:ABC transporter ATP-binding protein [Solirubrobacteraceae bacterium]